MTEFGTRRGFLIGALALVAAPAIVRAGSLMPVKATLVPGISMRELTEYDPVGYTRVDVLYGSKQWSKQLTLDEYSERILAPMANRLAEQVAQGVMDERNAGFMLWGAEDAVLGFEPIRNEDFYRPGGLLCYNKQRRSIDVIPQVPDSLALAAAAVAVAPVVLTKPMTRRFWGK